MRGAGDFPEPEVLRVVLPRHEVAQQRQVGLGLERQHGDVDVAADGRRRGRADDRLRRLGERGAEGAATAVHEEAVIDLRGRMDGIDVRDHAERRLRLADGDDALHLERAERTRARGLADRLACLRVDVVREAVAGMRERTVALGTDGLERQVDDADERRTPFDPDDLRGDADPRAAFTDELDVARRPVGGGIESGAHVQPLDDDRAVELLRVRRSIDEQARLEGRRCAVPGCRPHAVGAERGRVRVRARRAADEVLRFLVADRREVESRRRHEGIPRTRDGPLDGRARDLGAGRGSQRENGEGGGETCEFEAHGTS